MTNFEAYNSQKLDNNRIWLLFLLLGWSYGSMGKIGKQLFFYLTAGGLGLWTLYRLFTLGGSIKKHNRKLAVNCGLSAEEMIKLNLV
mgnify:CR=1 FL=1|tara:strand:+ start:363 stop:623 length:261 start_codon:yes stop_codon:yes gene_type:complete